MRAIRSTERVVTCLVVAAAGVLTLLTMGRAASLLVVVMAISCGLWASRSEWPPPEYLVAIFLAIGGGIGNGLGHLALSAREGGYFPGAYTGALALIVGSILAYRLMRRPIDVTRQNLIPE